jgi:hypothetical protein
VTIGPPFLENGVTKLHAADRRFFPAIRSSRLREPNRIHLAAHRGRTAKHSTSALPATTGAR